MIKSSTAIFAATNVTETVDFYARVLGFRQHWLWGNPPTFGAVGLGSAEIFISEQPRLAGVVEGHEHYFGVDDVDALHEQHRAGGATIVSPIENKPWGAREYVVRDINGYRLRFAGPAKYERPATARKSLPPQIRIELAAPSVEEYVDLLTSVQWTVTREGAEEVLRRSLLFVTARDGEKIVGELRCTGDGRYFMIWDVVVRPSHQGQKIGSAMMHAGVAELGRIAPPGAFVGLFTGKPGFYQRLGFKKIDGMHLTL